MTSDSLNPHTVLFEDSDNGIMIERVIDHVKSESESDELDGVMRLPDNTSDFEVCERFHFEARKCVNTYFFYLFIEIGLELSI